jgi:hypothetical protein
MSPFRWVSLCWMSWCHWHYPQIFATDKRSATSLVRQKKWFKIPVPDRNGVNQRRRGDVSDADVQGEKVKKWRRQTADRSVSSTNLLDQNWSKSGPQGFDFFCFWRKETRDRIHSSSFSSQIKNEPNKLECLITLGWKGMSVVNTTLMCNKLRRKLRLWIRAQGPYSRHFIFFVTYKQPQQVSVRHWTAFPF